jgi:diaminopimelate epimerase
MNFYKFHGTGNDFIMIENLDKKIELSSKKIAELCDRHFGIGADGLILVEKGQNGGDFFMNYYNSDGSTAEMCGNGTRCTAHFAINYLNFPGKILQIETRSGTKEIIKTDDNLYQVNMGKPDFTAFADFPNSAKILHNTEWHFASMGNPHAVGFFPTETEIDEKIKTIGAKIESDTNNFPNKINVNFVCQQGENHFIVKTYERGAGATLACGTGASASFAILKKVWNKITNNQKVRLDVPGGTLFFTFNESEEILMTGPSVEVFSGKISI